jgi:hypothetical protein
MHGCLAEICIHYYLRDSCKALKFSEEALEHGTTARELFKQQYFALDEDKRMLPWRDMLDLCADLLEELGMLKEALAYDQAFREHRGIQTTSALRREIEALLRGGFDEVNLHTTCLRNDYTCTCRRMHIPKSRGITIGYCIEGGTERPELSGRRPHDVLSSRGSCSSPLKRLGARSPGCLSGNSM